MYNNIFQVSTEPFTSDRLATATDVLYFANLPMSDVRSVEDRAYALQDFKKWMKTNKYGNCDSKRFILKTEAPELYFKEQYLEFLRAAIKLVVLPKEDFIRENGSLHNLMYDLESSYERVLNTYVMVDSDEPITMDAFIRTALLDTPYYFGSVFECRFG